MRGGTILMLAGILAGAGALPASAEATAEAQAKAEARRLEARALYQQGDYAGSAAAALAGLALLPEVTAPEENAADARVRAGLWQWAGVAAEATGDYAEARRRLETALTLYREIGARREVAATLNSLAAVQGRQGDRAAQLAGLIEAHALFADLGEVRGQAALANSLGNYFSEVGEPAKALPHHEHSVALRRTMDDAVFLAGGLENLGVTFRELGRDNEARSIYEQARALYRDAGDEEGLAGVLTNLGSLAGDEGRWDAALDHYREALAYDRAAGYRPGEAILLRNIGATLRRAGRAGEAVPWLDEAVALAEALAEPGRVASAREERSAAREAAGDPAGALADLRVAVEARSRLEEAGRAEAVLALQTRFEALQQEQRIDRLERLAAEQALGLARSEAARAEAERERSVETARRRTAWAVAGGALLGGALLVLLWRNRYHAARRLATQREELARALDELRTSHTELNRLYARKSEWLGFAVHELRGPLFGIDGCCAEVAAGVAESPVGTVAQIREAAARMRQELDAWLDAERREQEHVTLRRGPDDLGRLAAEVVAVNQPTARRKGMVLQHRATAPTPAEVDPWRWREVVDNLVSNALKFTPPGGRVLVSTDGDATRVWCRVEDNGPGITEADRAGMFGAFARLSARPTAGESSTGLGLHGVKRLVEAHGGEILVTTAEGGGAVFTVSLPRRPDEGGQT